MHVKGMELPAYDPRGSTGMALAYATSDRGGCHLRSWSIGAELLSTEERMDPFSREFKAEFVKTQQDLFTVLNATGFCLFAISALGMRQITEFLHSVTGSETFSSSEEILKAGERINNVVRLFNLRQGLSRDQDTLPRRFLERPLEEGPCRGRVVELRPLLEEYYLVRGWDQNGVPRPEKLKELDIEWR
jgi:aldehyde:ferredoxin oxidoreductase